MARVELLVTVDKVIGDNLQPVEASVLIKLRSTGSPVTIFSAETGGTTVPNPLATDEFGRVNGWVNEGSLVLTISGDGITTYNQPYEATRADSLVVIDGARIALGTIPGSAITNNSIPSTKLAAGSVLGKHLAESAMPLGTILAWWQPSKPGGGFSIPEGFALADGQTLIAPAHDFPGGSVTLPNLIDKMIIGADPSLGYGVNPAGAGGNIGMHGGIASNVANLQHQHPMPHTHSIGGHSHVVQNHVHWMQHQHTVYVPNHLHGLPIMKIGAGGSAITISVNGANTYGADRDLTTVSDYGNRNNTDGASPSTSSQTGGTVTLGVSTPNTSNALSATQDMRSACVGVLYIVKVKNTV